MLEHVGDLRVNWMDDELSVLDAATGHELKRVATGKNSRAFGAFIGDFSGNFSDNVIGAPHSP